MTYNLILKNVNKYINLNEQEIEYFTNLLRTKSIKRKQYLLRPGEICKYEIFITKGCLRNYTIDENGFEHIGAFAIEDWWTGDFYSFLTEKPSDYYIQALEDTDVLLISKQNTNLLYEKVPKFERFFRIQFQKSLIALHQRIHFGISQSAEERYLSFIEKYPQIEQRIPQKLIAAYLGVKPEYLSFLRKKLAKK